MSETGTIYLIHLDRPLGHAGHYLGWTAQEDPTERVADHFWARSGSKFMAAVARAGCTGRVVRTWAGTRSDERALKDRKNARGICPECLPSYNQEAAARMRRLRARAKKQKENAA